MDFKIQRRDWKGNLKVWTNEDEVFIRETTLGGKQMDTVCLSRSEMDRLIKEYLKESGKGESPHKRYDERSRNRRRASDSSNPSPLWDDGFGKELKK
jgi:hypothetical protein